MVLALHGDDVDRLLLVSLDRPCLHSVGIGSITGESVDSVPLGTLDRRTAQSAIYSWLKRSQPWPTIIERRRFFDEAKIDCFWHRTRGHGHLYGAIFGLLVPATRPEMGFFGLVKKTAYRLIDNLSTT